MDNRYYFSIASGSSGNCGVYVCDGTAVLIDAGVSTRRLRQGLALRGLDIPDLAAILITHEHIDHIKGLATLVKKYDTPLYATHATAKAMQDKLPRMDTLRTFFGGESFALGSLQVKSFLTPHDAAESVGYIITTADTAFGYCTDLGFMPSLVHDALRGCDAVVLESNHDPYLLETGPYPYPLKQRVRGPQGHLSNADCAQCAVKLAKQGMKTCILAHLSEQNNTPVTAFRETRQALDAAGATCELYVCPRETMEQPVLLDTAKDNVCCL